MEITTSIALQKLLASQYGIYWIVGERDGGLFSVCLLLNCWDIPGKKSSISLLFAKLFIMAL
jgi:hypothetical protein